MNVRPLNLPQPPASSPVRIWYRIIRGTANALFKVLFGFRCWHEERVPMTGPCLIACNHVSFLDPPAIGATSPREIFFFARKDLFELPILGPLIRSVNAVPIDRGSVDLAGLRQALRLLGEGKALLVFPEGTRSQDGALQRGQAGVGMLVARTNVPVLPVRVFGADKAWPRKKKLFRPGNRVMLAYGEPFEFELSAEEQKSRETYQAISDEIMRRIGELKPPQANAQN